MRATKVVSIAMVLLALGSARAEPQETKRYIASPTFPICIGAPTFGGACFTPPESAWGKTAHVAIADDTAEHAFGRYQIICETAPGSPTSCPGPAHMPQGEFCDGLDVDIPEQAGMLQIFVHTIGCYDIDDLATTGSVTVTWDSAGP